MLLVGGMSGPMNSWDLQTKFKQFKVYPYDFGKFLYLFSNFKNIMVVNDALYYRQILI